MEGKRGEEREERGKGHEPPPQYLEEGYAYEYITCAGCTKLNGPTSFVLVTIKHIYKLNDLW